MRMCVAACPQYSAQVRDGGGMWQQSKVDFYPLVVH